MEYISKIDQHKTHISSHLTMDARVNLLIIHGMAEHRFRYEFFMRTCNQHQINAYAFDLRGHGESKVDGHFGYFGKKKGYLRNVQDIHGIVEMIKKESDLPLVLLGHSMGSLFARAYLKYYPNTIDALILSGSPYLPRAFHSTHLFLKTMATLHPTKPASQIAKQMNQHFVKGIKDAKTQLDWLSFNEANVDAYQNDPLSNFPFTYQGYEDLFNLLEEVYLKVWDINNSPLPILFVIGKHDPSPDFKRDGFYKAIAKLQKAGYNNIKSIIYQHSRHELLQDNEKEKVTNDIIQFIHDLELN